MILKSFLDKSESSLGSVHARLRCNSSLSRWLESPSVVYTEVKRKYIFVHKLDVNMWYKSKEI